MVKTIDVDDFRKAFCDMGRREQFTHEGLKVLFYHLAECEEGMSEPMELDVIALCCEYCEYENLDDFQKDYSREFQSIEELKHATQVIMIDDTSFIIQLF